MPHKESLEKHLKNRLGDLFGLEYDLLLYDVTSTYFEANPPFAEADKRRLGHSRDRRSDCVQVVIALVVRRTLRSPAISSARLMVRPAML